MQHHFNVRTYKRLYFQLHFIAALSTSSPFFFFFSGRGLQTNHRIPRARKHLLLAAPTLKTLLLTVQSHVVVGEDGRFVPFGCAADDHMQHPVRGLDVMFLRDKNTSTRSHTCGGSSQRRPPVPVAGASHARAWSVKRRVRKTQEHRRVS